MAIDLKSVIERNNQWASNSILLKSVLSDLYPSERREINLIVNALECGVAESISKENLLNEIMINKFVSILDNEYGIQREMALFAIEAWASVYGVEISEDAKAKKISAEEVLKLYFSEDSHIYVLKNARVYGKEGELFNFKINTKHLILSWDRKNAIYGYGYFNVWYKENGKNVSFGLVTKRDPSRGPQETFEIEFDNEAEKNNFIVFLGCLKNGADCFSYPFDDTVIPSRSFCNEERVWKNYFSGDIVKPISFKARCIEHNEVLGDEIEHNDRGICSVTIDLDSPMGYEEAIGDSWSSARFQLRVVEADGSGTRSTMNIENMKWDVYLNKESQSFFIGSQYDYQQFIIQDSETLQDAFNYMAALCSQEDFFEYKMEDESDNGLAIQESSSLDVFVEDFAQNKTLKSCCSIIDITYKYAENIEGAYSNSLQEKCAEICFDYINKLKKLTKRGKVEKAYNYLAPYIEGNLHFARGEWVEAIKAYKECAAYSDFDGVEDEWPDDRLTIKKAVHNNMYFIYDILGIDFGKSVEEKIVAKAIVPELNSYITRRDELEKMIARDPSKAKEAYGNSQNTFGKVTNESMLDYYKKLINELQNWTQLPRYFYMKIDFTNYGSFTSSELADAAFEDKWGGVSISSIDEKDEITIDGNTVILSRDFTDPKIIIKDLASFKRKDGEKIKLLYLRY